MPTYLKDGADFDFPSDFGFTQSAKGRQEARSHPIPDQTDGGTYVEAKARGGRLHRAGGGDIAQETLSAPRTNFNAAFAAARRIAQAGGPKTFMWNGRHYTTDLAKTAPAPTRQQQAPRAMQGSEYAPQPAAAAGQSAYQEHADQPMLQQTARAPTENPYSLLTPDEEANANALPQERAHGGRIHKAVGGPIVPGAAGAPELGAMPGGAPGGPAQQRSPLANATITLPVQDAARTVAGAVQAGHALGTHQASMRGRMQGAPAVARPPMPQAAPAMAEGGGFHPGGEKGKLHHEMGIPEGQKIPAGKLEAAAHSGNPEKRRDAIRAQTMKKWHHGG